MCRSVKELLSLQARRANCKLVYEVRMACVLDFRSALRVVTTDRYFGLADS
ncbi:UNVERIFIED_ORG: hypothetical protein M2193_000024 [Bradyrhizobium japonicum]